MSRGWLVPLLPILASIMLVACSDDDASLAAEDGSTSEVAGSTSTSTSAATTSTSSTSSTTSTTGDDSDDGGYEGDGGDETGCAFTCPVPNPNPNGIGCSFFVNNCLPDEKCGAWSNDGGPIPNSTRCVPVAPSPREVGQSCIWEGSMVSGVDTCVEGAHCWGGPDDLVTSRCRAICGFDPDEPVCAAGTRCVSIGALPLCLDECDPLASDCGFNEACTVANGGFACTPAISFDLGPPGDPCEFDVECMPGTICVDEDELSSCFGGPGCCAELCDLNAVDPCPDADSCTPIPGAPPIAAFENVGICGW